MSNVHKIVDVGKPSDADWLENNILLSSRLPTNELITEVVQVTPELAKTILAECNYGNRAVRTTRVKAYADSMRDGRWKLTSQGISISRRGELNNGQHRLLAVVESGATVPMVLTFGEDRSVFDILDTGANRSASDALSISGFKQTSNLAAAARILMMIERGTPNTNASFSNDLIKDWVERHPLLNEYTTPGTHIGKKLRTSQAGCTTAFYLIGTSSRQREALPQYISLLNDGAGLTKRGPILTLRESLMRGDFVARVHAGIAGPIVAAAIINAWNLWLSDRKGSLPALTWKAGTPFPVVR